MWGLAAISLYTEVGKVAWRVEVEAAEERETREGEEPSFEPGMSNDAAN